MLKTKPTNRLRVLRAEHRVSQEDVAREVGMTQAIYWRVENGYRQASKDERRRLARAFKVAETDLGLPEASAN
jgi:transcriptional regulator with XRE-family HTH domain